MADRDMDIDLDDVPRLVAERLARRCWSVSAADLHQEAVAAALHAQRHFDPEKGELRGYLWRSVARHLTNYMWEQGSPVTYKHRRNELRDVRTTPVEHPTSGAVNLPHDMDVHADVAAAAWRASVARRLVAIAEGVRLGRVAAPCLLGEQTPLEAARGAGLSLSAVLDAVAALSEAVGRDPLMRELWRELSQSDDGDVAPWADGYDDCEET